MLVRFKKSPTGKYMLAYSAGQEADIADGELVKKMIEDGTAEAVNANPVAAKETTEAKPEKETRTKK